MLENKTINPNLAVRIILLALIICFFFPFCTFSCAYSEIEVNGVESTFGTEVMGEHIDGNILCGLLIIVPIALFAVTFLNNKIQFGEILYIIGSIIDIILLFIYRNRVLALAAESYATVKFRSGYYLEFILNIGLLVLAGIMLGVMKKTKGQINQIE